MAAVKNVQIDQGSNGSFSIAVSGSPNLQGYTANAYYKRHTESANSFDFNTTLNSNGLLVCSLNAASSAANAEGQYVYHVFITETSSNTTTKVQEGIFTLQNS